jgi:hypothetical protein
MNNRAIFTLLLLIGTWSVQKAYAVSFPVWPISHLLHESHVIAKVQIVGGKLLGQGKCGYQYSVDPIHIYKGKIDTNYLVMDSQALVGGQYLIIGNQSHVCGRSVVSIQNGVSPAMYPILPIGLGLGDDETFWVDTTLMNVTLPDEVRQVRSGAGCLDDITHVDICVIGGSAANWHDFEKMLKGSLGSP